MKLQRYCLQAQNCTMLLDMLYTQSTAIALPTTYTAMLSQTQGINQR